MVSDEDDAWKEWGPEIVTGIEKGWLDKFLRDIVRAAFARKMKSHLIPDDVADAMAREHREAQAAKLAPAPSLSEPITMVRKITDGYAGLGTFEVGGNLYLKSDVIGKTFAPNANTIKPRQGTNWRSVTFYVLEINPKNIVVIMNEPPSRMDARLRALYYAGRPITIDKNILRTILEK